MLEGNYDYVFWIDADVMFKKMINEEIILRDILPEDNNYLLFTKTCPTILS